MWSLPLRVCNIARQASAQEEISTLGTTLRLKEAGACENPAEPISEAQELQALFWLCPFLEESVLVGWEGSHGEQLTSFLQVRQAQSRMWMTLRHFCYLSKNWATSGAWRRGEAPLLQAGVLKVMSWDPKAHC